MTRPRLTDEQRELVRRNVQLVGRRLADLNHHLTHDQAEELRGELYLALCHAAQAYRPDAGAFSTCAYWWFRSATSRFFEVLHRSIPAWSRHLSHQDGDGFDGAAGVADHRPAPPDPDALALFDLSTRVLPRPEAEIIRSYYLDGLTMREIGDRMGLHREYVRQLRDRACVRLRTYLQARPGGKPPPPEDGPAPTGRPLTPRAEAFRAAQQVLSPRDYRLLYYRLVRRMSVRALAAHFNLTVDQCRRRIVAAVARVRDRMGGAV